MLCAICGNPIEVQPNGWAKGHNAKPVRVGRCCKKCNYEVVLPARMGAPYDISITQRSSWLDDPNSPWPEGVGYEVGGEVHWNLADIASGGRTRAKSEAMAIMEHIAESHTGKKDPLKVGDNFRTSTGRNWRVIEPYQPPVNRQCFFIGADLLMTLGDEEEIYRTVDGMKEMGLYKLPYDVVDIKFYADELLTFIGQDGSTRKDMKFGRNSYVIMTGVGSDNPQLIMEIDGNQWIDISDYLSDNAHSNFKNHVLFYKDVLIVLLATKGVEKSRHRNPMAAMKIGKSKSKHVYTTTLKIRPDWYRKEAQATGLPRSHMRPHLRRGHIRRQHYGPKREAVKKVWIEACFVNGDDNFVNERKAYNMSRGEGNGQSNPRPTGDVPVGDPGGTAADRASSGELEHTVNEANEGQPT